ncbi:MAG: glycosyltransferase family 39 protein [Verrucomicrobiota bacterium]
MLTRCVRQFQLFALGLVLLTVVTRLPSLIHPQAIDDEEVYSIVANEIVDGGRPYIDAVERKPPLLFWTYAAVFKTAGKFNWPALHIFALLWVLATMAGLYVIGRGLFDRTTGLFAALLYSVFQPWATWKDLGFNGETLMNLPIVWAWAIGLRKRSSRTRPDLLVAGALLAAGFLLKQPAAIAAVPLGIFFLLPSYRASRGLTIAQSITHAATLTVGFFTALGAVALILRAQGILHDAFYWTITDHSVPYVFWAKGIALTLAFIGACLPMMIGAAMSWRDVDGVWSHRKAERVALFGLVVASAVGASAGGRFYTHYFIQLIPPLVLLAAPHYARIWNGKTTARHWLLRPAVTCVWLALTVVAFSTAHWVGLAPHRESSEAARYLFEHSAPGEKIFVWGQQAGIYIQAQRRPACRYITTFPLTGYIFGGEFPGLDTRDRILPGAWANLQQDFQKHPPVYIIDTQTKPDAQYPTRNFPVLARLLAEHYQFLTQTRDGLIYRIR